MSQPPPSTVSNRQRFVAWLLGVWGVIFFALWWVLPVQPRLTIRDGDQFEIIGITPDNNEFAAFTKRALRYGADLHQEVPSGPIQFVNLTSGTRRSLPVPGQNPTGELVVTTRNKRRMLDSEFWYALRVQHAFRGDWLHFRMLRADTDKIRRLVLLNVNNGDTAVIEPTPATTSFRVSPAGGYYAEEFWDNGERSVRIMQTASRRQVLSFDRVVEDGSWSFSPDDYYFGCTISENDSIKTHIWNVETGKVVQSLDGHIRSLGFSQSHRLITGWIARQVSAEGPRHVEFGVWDVETGMAICRLGPLAVEDLDLSFPDWTSEFISNDERVLFHGLFNDSSPYESEVPFHARPNLKLDWNLTLDVPKVYPTLQSRAMYDPNISTRSNLPASLPSACCRYESNLVQLFEMTTGEQLYTLPDDSEPILLTRDSRTLVLQQPASPSFIGRLLKRIRAFGIPVPRFTTSIVSENAKTWSVIDVPSGRTIAVIPAQHEIHYLSGDAQTLVTVSEDDSPVINVWDFPLRKGILRPLYWSLLAPALMLCSKLRWRRRVTSQGAAA